MSKEVKEYLDYLKANEYIWGYEKKDNYKDSFVCIDVAKSSCKNYY